MQCNYSPSFPSRHVLPAIDNVSKVDIPKECDTLCSYMISNKLSVEQALETLWGEDEPSGNRENLLENLRFQCARGDAKTQEAGNQIRLALTRRLVDEDQSLSNLSEQINNLHQAPENADTTTGKLIEKYSELVTVHLEARKKTAAVRDSPFFSYLYLAALAIQAAVTALLSDVFGRKTTHSEAAQAAINKEAKALLLQHIRSPQTLPARRPAPIGTVEIDTSSDVANDARETLEKKLDELPASVRNYPNWRNVKNRMKAYLNHTHKQQGAKFVELMSDPATSLEKMLMSMEIHCKLGVETARSLAFQREIWNLAQEDRPSAEQNRQVTGWNMSLANHAVCTARHGDLPEILKPGNQLVLAMDTPLIREDQKIVEVTILSVIAPALDSRSQPEYELYAESAYNDETQSYQPTKFFEGAYATSYETIKQQVLGYARAHPEKTEITLTGVGLQSYVQGLQFTESDGNINTTFKDQAVNIGVDKLAELAVELRTLGKAVDFTDISPNLVDKVNDRLGELAKQRSKKQDAALFEPIKLAGKIPGNWITANRIIMNAWDTHSLVGNKQKDDRSLDGFIGRNSLVHLVHALRCAMEAEGIPRIDLA